MIILGRITDLTLTLVSGYQQHYPAVARIQFGLLLLDTTLFTVLRNNKGSVAFLYLSEVTRFTRPHTINIRYDDTVTLTLGL